MQNKMNYLLLGLLTFCGVCIAILPVHTRAQDGMAQTIDLGCWNIEWLGKSSSRKDVGHNVDQTAADLADYILASKVSVLGVEEISDNDGGKNKTIRDAFEIIKTKTGKTWDHELFPKPDGGKDQCIGVAWNSDTVKKVGATMKIDVPNKVDVSGASNMPIWNRHPHAVKFSLGDGKSDFVFIVVHMKANTGGTPSPKRKREFEAKTLMSELTKIQTKMKDFDIVIAGDTNILSKNEKAATIFTSFGFKDQNEEDEGSFIFGNAPFDRFFVPDDQPEFQGMDQQIFDSEYLDLNPSMTKVDFRKRFSDHFMVKSQIKILADDDAN